MRILFIDLKTTILNTEYDVPRQFCKPRYTRHLGQQAIIFTKIQRNVNNYFEKYLEAKKRKTIFANKKNNNNMIILSVKQFSDRLKVTIQSSGRLNFTDDAAKILAITEETLIRFALDEENNNTLYLVVSKDINDTEAFKVRKSGAYYYLPTKNMFDALGIEYEKKSLGYDLIRTRDKDDILGGVAYRMSPREKNKNGGEDEINN